MKRMDGKAMLGITLGVLLCGSLVGNVWQKEENDKLVTQISVQRQREMTDVVTAMADIEVNLAKLLIASGASQSVSLLGETAMLAQHVENGLSRLPLRYETATDAMKFVGQMGEYTMTLAAQVSSGGALTGEDERQITQLLTACQALNEHLLSVGGQLYDEPLEDADVIADSMQGWQEAAIGGNGAIEYPSLIYDGPFSDGRTQGAPKGLSGERITREQARTAAARFAGTTVDRVADAADSGGMFEAFGFSAETQLGRVNVQVTGQGAHLLFMMPENAEYRQNISQQACLDSAQTWLTSMGFGDMELCFSQQYGGMVVANFAAVQEGVLLYPDQVKIQVSMENGAIVGAECSQFLTNHARRTGLEATITRKQAQDMLSSKLDVYSARLCVIPKENGETLCWGFEGEFAGSRYWVFVDAHTGEAADILRVLETSEGEMAI